MTSLPIFMTAVANSPDEPTFPLSFVWSTPDAQIKEVLITPDDEWLANGVIEPNYLNIDEQQLYEFGYEASDILAEWVNEFDTDVVYALDPELVTRLVEATFDSKGLDPSFEVLSLYSWFEEQGVSLSEALEENTHTTPIHLMAPDELIAQLLNLAVEYGLINPDEVSSLDDE